MTHYHIVTYKNTYGYRCYINYEDIIFSDLQNDRKDNHNIPIASISTYRYGKLSRKEWWEKGQIHNLFFPAVIYYDPPFYGEWWFKGNKYDLFNENKYLYLQFIIKFLYFSSKNANMWSPKNLGGKCTKNFLMRLITKN